VVIGVLSALPIISVGNCFCCMWIIGGGMLAAYLLQQNSSEPMTQSDAALVGLLAGLVGAGVWLVVSIPMTFLFGPMTRQMLQRMLENSEGMPPRMREALQRSSANGALQGAQLLLGFCMYLILGAIFGTIGGLLGGAFFRKPPAPQSPPSTI
jgi:hypothetical protein